MGFYDSDSVITDGVDGFEYKQLGSSSVNNDYVPSPRPNNFGRVKYTHDGLIYDPAYIMKFKNPNIHKIIDRLNQFAVAITELQMVVTDIVTKEGPETRRTLERVWEYTKRCCDADEVNVNYSGMGNLWDGNGVYQEGLDPYTLHISIGD